MPHTHKPNKNIENRKPHATKTKREGPPLTTTLSHLFLRLFLYSCFLASLGTTFPSFSDALAFHIRRLVSSLPVITNLPRKKKNTSHGQQQVFRRLTT